jgi:hypothetical protein
VDNNNAATLAQPTVQTSDNTNNTAAVLEAWARNLERGVSPCTPEEDDEEDDEGKDTIILIMLSI